MALLQKSSLAAPARTSRASSVVVRASAEPHHAQGRRAVLGSLLGLAALAAPKAAEAIELPWQKSTGGQGIGGGAMNKNGSTSSQSGYVLEGYPGTKKSSYISPKEKRMMKAEAREKAERMASSSTD